MALRASEHEEAPGMDIVQRVSLGPIRVQATCKRGATAVVSTGNGT
jgi:hypothetical protein